MNRNTFRQIVNRYLKGKASQKEKNAIDHWYDQFPNLEDKDVFTDERMAQQQGAYMFDRISSNWNLAPRAVHRRRLLRPLSIAAASALVLSFSLWYFWHSNFSVGPTRYRTVSTVAGQVEKVQLPDGTVAWINARSTVRFPLNVKGNKLEIFLDEGEASFEVHSDPQRPFIVHSGSLKTEVLGTVFNVRNYGTLLQTSVFVQQGQVRVSNNDPKVIPQVLGAQQHLVYDKTTKSFIVDNNRESQGAGWQEGLSRLRDASFDELALAFANLYNVSLHTDDDQIRHRYYNLTLTRQYTMEQTLKIICSINNNQYRRTSNGKIILY